MMLGKNARVVYQPDVVEEKANPCRGELGIQLAKQRQHPGGLGPAVSVVLAHQMEAHRQMNQAVGAECDLASQPELVVVGIRGCCLATAVLSPEGKGGHQQEAATDEAHNGKSLSPKIGKAGNMEKDPFACCFRLSFAAFEQTIFY